MQIRRAIKEDIQGLHSLLAQVEMIHHQGRPDLFKAGARKYSDEELEAILRDDSRPVFAAIGDDGEVLGYAFCVFQQKLGDNILTDIKDAVYR